jgi:hypothetical protein
VGCVLCSRTFIASIARDRCVGLTRVLFNDSAATPTRCSTRSGSVELARSPHASSYSELESGEYVARLYLQKRKRKYLVHGA